MANNVRDRIAERTEIADAHLKEQGFLGRIGNRIGLTAANTMDGADAALGGGNRRSFLGGTVIGALKGALIGGIVTVLAIGLTIIPAAVGTAAFLTITGLSAAAGGIAYGQKALERHTAVHKRSIPDRVAVATDAIPDARMVNPIVEQEHTQKKPVEGFVTREMRRREEAYAHRGSHGHHH